LSGEPRGGLERSAAGAILLVVSLVVFVQILSRYCFHRSLSFTEEITRHLFIWATMLGAAAAAREGSHLGIVLLSRWMPPMGKKILRVTSSLGTALLFAVIFVASLGVLRVQVQTKQLTPALGWPIWWVSSAVTVGCLLMALRSVLGLRRERAACGRSAEDTQE